MSTLLKLLFLTLILNFLLPTHAFFANKPIHNIRERQGGEDKGKGITDQ